MAPPAETGFVYVHAPFCARRCVYCDFAVEVRREGDATAWLAAVRGELRTVAREGLLRLAPRLETLYVGGGTPSLLGAAAMEGLAGAVGPERLADSALEWTAEANPESFTPELAAAWRTAGVNRVSLGAQTFHAPALRWMGRLHGPEGPREAVVTARRAGFENVSIDLIFSLPAHLGRDWARDLERAIALDVEHVSLYGLGIEEGTPLGRAVAEGREPPADEERYREEYLLAVETLRAAGFEHYEVSNFARPGRRARHNAAYWEGVPYLGLGNGAHSFAPPVRRWNHRGWAEYATLAAAGRSPEAGRERLDAGAARLESVWLALRTAAGYDLAGAGPRARALARDWTVTGLAEEKGAHVRLTPRGWLVLDRLAVDLEAALAG